LAAPLKKAGLTRLNIGCDSINKSSVKSIKAIENGLLTAKKVGFNPIKINMVLLKGINDTEIQEMIAFSQKENFILQIIELINSNLDGFYEQYHVSLDQVEKILSQQAVKIINRKVQDRKQYQLPGGNIIELVQPVDNSHFCAQCHTMRITNDFQFQPCINRNDNLVPIANDIEIALAQAMRNRRPFNEQKK
jgi:cyclic pyranopterin phosphate synthase